jgi:hypothetical protein
VKKYLSIILMVAVLLMLVIMQVGCKKKIVEELKKQTLEEQLEDLFNIRLKMGLKEHEACYKWDRIGARLYLAHQSGHTWMEIQKDMLTKDFLATWLIPKSERNFIAIVFISLMQRADNKERPSGAFTIDESMNIAHALCGEFIIKGGLPFRTITYFDTETAKALIASDGAD